MTKIERVACIARTAHDQKHGNHLVVPEFGAVEIRLKTAGKKSKSFLPDTSAPRRTPSAGGDEVFQFAPGPQLDAATWAADASKKDPVNLWYDLFNPFSAITEAKIELFRRWDDKPLWTRELKGDELLDGEHDLEFECADSSGSIAKSKDWDGSVPVNASCPDGFVNTRHSPYRLRLTVKGEGRCTSPVAWTYFHVLIDKLELEWGDEKMIAKVPARRQPFKELKAAKANPTLGTDADPAKIFLISHVFKRTAEEMFKNALFTNYETMWGAGPEIPILAKVFVRNSGGQPVVAPKALGTTRFLWDWESKQAATGQDFTDKAQDYDSATTTPKGQNCHADRGGKRGHATLRVIPNGPGYTKADWKEGAFPFWVNACDAPRTWASYSTAWREGEWASKTGVMFQPARTAGDKYKITAYAAHEISDATRKPRLDVADDALQIDAALKAESGIFQVWRKVYFQKYLTKDGGSTGTLPGIKAFYAPAFLEVEDKSGGAIDKYPAAEWNTEFAKIRAIWSSNDQLRIDPAVDQYAAGKFGLKFRTRAEFRDAMIASMSVLATFRTDLWMGNNNCDTDAKYAAGCQELAKAALIQLFDKKFPADDGISLFHVMYSMQIALLAAMTSFTDGQAADFPSGSPSKCAFLWMAPTTQYSAALGPDATPAHEIGHHLMLPHPRNTGENTGTAANNDYDAHDRGVDNCLMSYKNAARELCGFCRLRLRGWDKSKLLTEAGKNKKP